MRNQWHGSDWAPGRKRMKMSQYPINFPGPPHLLPLRPPLPGRPVLSALISQSWDTQAINPPPPFKSALTIGHFRIYFYIKFLWRWCERAGCEAVYTNCRGRGGERLILLDAWDTVTVILVRIRTVIATRSAWICPAFSVRLGGKPGAMHRTSWAPTVPSCQPQLKNVSEKIKMNERWAQRVRQ